MQSAFGGDYPVSDIEHDSKQSGSSLKRFLVLYNNDQPVACSRYLKFINKNKQPYIILCDLGVKKEFQGQGYGKKMFLLRLSYIFENEDFIHIFSEIEDNNFPSIAISKKFGLEEVVDNDLLSRFSEVN